MSVKELLLSCIVMIHVSFMVSRPIEIKTFRDHMEALEDFSVFCNLKRAETNYVRDMFDGKQQNVEPIEGITYGNTTEEIQASICAISGYLKKLRTLTEDILRDKEHNELINETNKFLVRFDEAVEKSRVQNETIVPKQCDRNVTTSDDYNKKVTGLRIIQSTMRWLETFTGRNTSCTSKIDKNV